MSEPRLDLDPHDAHEFKQAVRAAGPFLCDVSGKKKEFSGRFVATTFVGDIRFEGWGGSPEEAVQKLVDELDKAAAMKDEPVVVGTTGTGKILSRGSGREIKVQRQKGRY